MSTKLQTSTSSQFNDAMLRQLHVTVYQQDELLDVGGIIEKHTHYGEDQRQLLLETYLSVCGQYETVRL